MPQEPAPQTLIETLADMADDVAKLIVGLVLPPAMLFVAPALAHILGLVQP